MRKSIPARRHDGFASIADVPSFQEISRQTAFMVIPSVMKICATSNGEQRVHVCVLAVQGLSQKQ